MQKLLTSLDKVQKQQVELPFSVYHCRKEQRLLNVPIIKPLLVVVIHGEKQLGPGSQIKAQAGQFVFLSDSPAIHIRNIPKSSHYCAVLIEFEYADFSDLHSVTDNKPEYIIGHTSDALQSCVTQFIDCCLWAPSSVLALRRKEILSMLLHMGYTEVKAMKSPLKLSHQLHDLFIKHQFNGLTMQEICQHVAMSESTLRRRLHMENNSLKTIKSHARLSLALDLLQKTQLSIQRISQQCGYLSQSRFTDFFKKNYGLTPSALRKTLLTDLGE